MKMTRLLIPFLLASTALIFGQTTDTSPLNDPVALLAKRIERGEVKLDYNSGGWGYLGSLLEHLDINVDSQVLVFSKTGFQLSKIAPETPRAIYFNDSVSVGSVQGGSVFELTSLEPSQGLVFYTMDTQNMDETEPAVLI
jgi:hypothetical protein